MEEIESNSYSEVLKVIELLPDDYKNKIPEKQMNIIIENSNKEYFSKISSINQINEIPLTEKAHSIIIALWLNYIATDIQKKKVNEYFNNNTKLEIKTCFKKSNDTANILPVEYKKKENIFLRILKKIFIFK